MSEPDNPTRVLFLGCPRVKSGGACRPRVGLFARVRELGAIACGVRRACMRCSLVPDSHGLTVLGSQGHDASARQLQRMRDDQDRLLESIPAVADLPARFCAAPQRQPIGEDLYAARVRHVTQQDICRHSGPAFPTDTGGGSFHRRAPRAQNTRHIPPQGSPAVPEHVQRPATAAVPGRVWQRESQAPQQHDSHAIGWHTELRRGGGCNDGKSKRRLSHAAASKHDVAALCHPCRRCPKLHNAGVSGREVSTSCRQGGASKPARRRLDSEPRAAATQGRRQPSCCRWERVFFLPHLFASAKECPGRGGLLRAPRPRGDGCRRPAKSREPAPKGPPREARRPRPAPRLQGGAQRSDEAYARCAAIWVSSPSTMPGCRSRSEGRVSAQEAQCAAGRVASADRKPSPPIVGQQRPQASENRLVVAAGKSRRGRGRQGAEQVVATRGGAHEQ